MIGKDMQKNKVSAVYLSELKRKIRKLKQAEKDIRFRTGIKNNAPLVWDRFFDLNSNASDGKYTLDKLAVMSSEEYDAAINKFFAHVYYVFYKESGIIDVGLYDPEVLKLLDLPHDADETDVKSKFRELAKIHHPDAGGDAEKFIELMKAYKGLVGAFKDE